MGNVAKNKQVALNALKEKLGVGDDFQGKIAVDVDDLTEQEISVGILQLRVSMLKGIRGGIAIPYRRTFLGEIFSDIDDVSVSIPDLNGRFDNQALANAVAEKYGLEDKLLVRYTTSDVRLTPTIELTAHPLCEDYYGSVTVTVKEK